MKKKKTAYSRNQAKAYDFKRFESPNGKAINIMELSLLRYFLDFTLIKKNILEVGCGTGRILIELYKQGFEVEGVDASKDMLKEFYKKNKTLNARIKTSMMESKNLKLKNKYDFIYSIRLLNQTQSKNYALGSIKEMVRVTKPGGYVLIEFVNINRPKIGRNATKTIRLSHKIIVDNNFKESWGCSIVKEKGLFFFGMGTIMATPTVFINIMIKVDKFFSSLFPRLCSRGYILLKKNAKKN